jgi:signal transduction histidine kinase
MGRLVSGNLNPIPQPDHIFPDLFDRFYRADPACLQGSESGLGLATARSIVEAHGGSISDESEAGEGTKVKFVFPLV